MTKAIYKRESFIWAHDSRGLEPMKVEQGMAVGQGSWGSYLEVQPQSTETDKENTQALQ